MNTINGNFIEKSIPNIKNATIALNIGGVDATMTVEKFAAALPVSTVSYKSYVASMSQTAAAAPTSEIIINELSGTPSWSRINIGLYQLTLTGAFPLNKTFINTISSDVSGIVYINKLNANTIEFVFANDNVSNYVIEIRVYN